MKKIQILSALKEIDSLYLKLRKLNFIVIDDMKLGEIKRLLLERFGEGMYKENKGVKDETA